jgi:hypothetical protein
MINVLHGRVHLRLVRIVLAGVQFMLEPWESTGADFYSKAVPMREHVS